MKTQGSLRAQSLSLVLSLLIVPIIETSANDAVKSTTAVLNDTSDDFEGYELVSPKFPKLYRHHRQLYRQAESGEWTQATWDEANQLYFALRASTNDHDRESWNKLETTLQSLGRAVPELVGESRRAPAVPSSPVRPTNLPAPQSPVPQKLATTPAPRPKNVEAHTSADSGRPVDYRDQSSFQQRAQNRNAIQACVDAHREGEGIVVPPGWGTEEGTAYRWPTLGYAVRVENGELHLKGKIYFTYPEGYTEHLRQKVDMVELCTKGVFKRNGLVLDFEFVHDPRQAPAGTQFIKVHSQTSGGAAYSQDWYMDSIGGYQQSDSTTCASYTHELGHLIGGNPDQYSNWVKTRYTPPNSIMGANSDWRLLTMYPEHLKRMVGAFCPNI